MLQQAKNRRAAVEIVTSNLVIPRKSVTTVCVNPPIRVAVSRNMAAKRLR
jgi:hypothetical protein